MFKLFQLDYEEKKEILPENDIYTVRELADYQFIYTGNINSKFQDIVFIEDSVLDPKFYKLENGSLISEKNKFFQDYFGFASLIINENVYKLNIQIEKFNLSEIEEILLYLWSNEKSIFYNFFSKSTIKTNISQDGAELGLTSKFLHFSDYFYNVFSKLLPYFLNSPHTVLRTKKEFVNYSPNKVTSSSIDWLLTNLDHIHFDNKLMGHPDAILINNMHGCIDKLESDLRSESYNIYENQIILGAFVSLISKLNILKTVILSNIDKREFSNTKLIDFRDLKKIPYLRLLDESNSIEKKLKVLQSKYQKLFKKTSHKVEIPKITAIFSNKSHYRLAFKTIKDLLELKYNFEGELQLLNIRKLSQLYEVYNLYKIVESFSEYINLNSFEKNIYSKREDGIPNRITFSEINCSINIYYELKYPNKDNLTLLQRINTSNKSYYEPDFIIEIKNKESIKYFLIDSKYSKLYTIKDKHLPECVFKYLLNTGIKDELYKKPDYLILLYPGEIIENYIKSEIFYPQVILIPSKPKQEEHLKSFIRDVVNKEIPKSLHK